MESHLRVGDRADKALSARPSWGSPLPVGLTPRGFPALSLPPARKPENCAALTAWSAIASVPLVGFTAG